MLQTEEQLALRAERLQIRVPNLFLFNASNLEVGFSNQSLTEGARPRWPLFLSYIQNVQLPLRLSPGPFPVSVVPPQEIIDEMADLQPHAVVVDSIQTVYLPGATGRTGQSSAGKCCPLLVPLDSRGVSRNCTTSIRAAQFVVLNKPLEG